MNKKDVLQHLSRSTSPNDCCTSVDSSFAVPSKAQPVSTCLDTLSRKIFSSSTHGATLEERVVLDGSSSISNAGVFAYQRKKKVEPAGNWEYCF